MPAYVAAAPPARERRGFVLSVDAGLACGAGPGPLGETTEGATRAADLEVVEVIEASAAGQRQDLWNDVEVERSEERELVIAALHILEESIVVVAGTRVIDGRSGRGR